eukprot:TRINITY_DN2135_c0_g1_i1.p1 TRINITY_DN2135_c0_g1~~TRINITY_DN2135_c0_g1_i1.p1  ORF type:complete len:320 (-),score=112.20 TRINITY_DN2135_c0_g1_i1:12-971(-)
MLSRKTQYAVGGEGGDKDAVSAQKEASWTKLVEGYADAIDSWDEFPLFSKEWVAMIDSIGYIAGVATMEAKAPEAANEEGTLWEREEMCLRLILEHHKSSLLLNLIQQTKEHQRTFALNPIAVEADIKVTRHDKAFLANHLRSAEQNIGALMGCLLRVREALQTCDLSLLFSHAKEVFTFAVAHQKSVVAAEKDKIPESSQESLLLTYLASLGRHLEDLPEDTVSNLLVRNEVAKLVARHICANRAVLAPHRVFDGCVFLSSVMGSEEFLTHPEEFVDDTTRAQVVQINETFLTGHLASGDAALRSGVSNLILCASKWK